MTPRERLVAILRTARHYRRTQGTAIRKAVQAAALYWGAL